MLEDAAKREIFGVDMPGMCLNRWSDYELNGGIISKEQEASLITFSPFQANPIPEEIVSNVLGEERKQPQEMKLYTLFASLQGPDDYYRFTQEYGLIHSTQPTIPSVAEDAQLFISQDLVFQELMLNLPTKVDLYHEGHFVSSGFQQINDLEHPNLLDSMDCEAIEGEIIQFRRLLELNAYLKGELSEQTVFGDLGDYSLKNQGYYYYLKAATFHIIAKTFEYKLKNVHPLLNNRLEQKKSFIYRPEWQWKIDSLMEAMYLMFFLDITTNGSPRMCANPRCNRVFVPSKKSAIYCSSTCHNRANQQRYKERIRQKKKQG